MSDNAIAKVEHSYELSVTEVKSQVNKIQELMRDLMQENVHYGESYPGDVKKNLLKPGADKLCFMFRLRPDFVQEIQDLPGGHMKVITRCQIYHIESGQKIAEGVGIASTMESKYRWRNATQKCPACGKEAIIKGKKEYGGGFVCYVKKGGCGAKYQDDDPAITGQVTGKVENPDIADTYNTVIKMSKKRAYVDATITACAASDIFTQDAEDIRNEDVKNETGSMANEALHESAPDAAPGSEPSEDNLKRNQIIAEIAEIMNTLSQDGLALFTEAKKAMEREIIKGSAGIGTLKNQLSRLRNELEKRKRDYKPIPFNDEKVPAMYKYNKPETGKDDDFGDDIF